MHEFEKEGMTYYISRPRPPVSYFVDHYMVARGYPEFTTERLFPNNEVELFFNLGDINKGKIFTRNKTFYRVYSL
ncbi:MAG: hypothetical protein KDC53_14570 [Saprospiraceae bacterium]|nr:hypothetical protein [Saprospiraceae bacterium]